MRAPDGLFLEDLVLLQALADCSEPPQDVEAAAKLLRRWMHLRLEDKPHGPYVHAIDGIGFLAWLLRDLGHQPYARIKAAQPEEAAEIRRQILVLCFGIQDHRERLGVRDERAALGRQHAEAARMFPEFALGAADARF